MYAVISPHPLCGQGQAIPSKSDAHRKLILSALADGPTRIRLPAQTSADLEATERCLTALGAVFSHSGEFLTVTPIAAVPSRPLLDCGESGSTLRFLLPVAAALCDDARFTGGGRLPERPIHALKAALEAHGVCFSNDLLPFSLHGALRGGEFSLPGDVSSQYITGLLLALALLREESRLTLTTPLQSAGYVDITLRAMECFGVTIRAESNHYELPDRQTYHSPGTLDIEGDWSNASFVLAAGVIGAPVSLSGLSVTSPQGDRAIVSILRQFGGEVSVLGDVVSAAPGTLHGCNMDVSEIPDALPILAVVAAAATGETRFTNAARLRLKESDRLRTTAAMINALGGHAEDLPDGLRIFGGQPLTGGSVDGANDHRIVMAAAIAAILCTGPVTISGAEAVRKSYPAFFEDYRRLGGIANVF